MNCPHCDASYEERGRHVDEGYCGVCNGEPTHLGHIADLHIKVERLRAEVERLRRERDEARHKSLWYGSFLQAEQEITNRIADWLEDSGQNSWCAHHAFPPIKQRSSRTGEPQICVTPVDADEVAEAIRNGEWK